MVKKVLGSEAKKEYVKPLLTRNEPLVDITFTSGSGGPASTVLGKPVLGNTPGKSSTGVLDLGGAVASAPMEIPGEIGGSDGGAGTLVGGGTVVPGTGGAPGTVL